jgi:hypothetical protein
MILIIELYEPSTLTDPDHGTYSERGRSPEIFTGELEETHGKESSVDVIVKHLNRSLLKNPAVSSSIA